MTTAPVYVIDDDPSVMRALRRMLTVAGLPVVTHSSATGFLDAFDADPASFAEGCIVLDVAMPGMTGLQLQDALEARRCALSVIFLSGHGDIPMSVKAIRHGAADFLTKPVDRRQLIESIDRAMLENRARLDERRARAEIESRLALLTAREREVMAHVVAGKLNKQIASDLGTVENTIKVHRARIMQKMGVRSLAQLVRLADQVGIKPIS